ncbi:hypothetical protein CLU79DRAFT_765361 [Phycomyces nitens]|nr:hypothetical protein CLU79DRAFT_765361 [Phycomyces nitens]
MSLDSLFFIPPPLASSDPANHYQTHFDTLARKILLDHDLYIGDKRYDILEVEMYLNTSELGHEDPHCHNHPLQKTFSNWYFHRIGKTDGFKGGSRKGVDITMGNPENDTKGGMIIRAIKEHGTDRLVEGPSLVVDEILKVHGYTSLKVFVTEKWKNKPANCWATDTCLYLVKKETKDTSTQVPAKRRKIDRPLPIDTIYASCRVGLRTWKANTPYDKCLWFVGIPYRYVQQPWLLKKGRIWTVLEMLDKNMAEKDIASLNNISINLVKKYKEAYEKGQDTPLEALRHIMTKDILSDSL